MSKKLSIVITDGIGFRNFVMSNFIQKALKNIGVHEVSQTTAGFGKGNSAELFLSSLQNEDLWKVNHQKQFRDN